LTEDAMAEGIGVGAALAGVATTLGATGPAEWRAEGVAAGRLPVLGLRPLPGLVVAAGPGLLRFPSGEANPVALGAGVAGGAALARGVDAGAADAIGLARGAAVGCCVGEAVAARVGAAVGA